MPPPIEQKQVTTRDGTSLNLLETGTGTPLLLVPGWSQTAAMFRHQLTGLSDRFRVIAIDHRGHGDSSKPEGGYRVARLARDLHDVLETLGLEGVAALGHSMGNAVLWSHIELFGTDRFAKLIIAEQPPTLLSHPAWSSSEQDVAGCIMTPEELVTNCDALVGPDAETFGAQFVEGMLSAQVSPEDRRFIVEENLKMPRQAAARLLQDTASADWRDFIPSLDLPTLVIAGKGSMVPFASQLWIQQHVAGSRLEAIEADEGGSHFMFWENPAKFNQAVASFLD